MTLSPGAAVTLAVVGLFLNALVLSIGVRHGSRSEAFLLKEGLAWCILTELEAALWAVIVRPLWTMVHQLSRLVRRPQLARAATFVAFFWVAAWLPWFLTPNATSPLVGESWKTDIMAGGGATVAAVAVAGISLVDAVIRNRRFGAKRAGARSQSVGSRQQQEELRLYLWLYGYLNRFVWALGAIVGFATLCIYSLYQGLTAYYSRPTLNVAEIWGFSAYAVVLILVLFLPTYLELLSAGRRIRDAYYELALPDHQNYDELKRRRDTIERMLRLNPASLASVRTVVAISAPFASSAVAMLSNGVLSR